MSDWKKIQETHYAILRQQEAERRQLAATDPDNTVPSVVPPPEWGKPYKMAKGWGIDAACDCQISVEDSQPGLPFVAPCEQHSKHSLGALDSGLALLRGALAQQRTEP